MKVLVLGASGMLGSMVFDYLARNPKLSVVGTLRNSKDLLDPAGRFADFDVNGDLPGQLTGIFDSHPAEYIVNCIGVINRYCRDDDEAGVLRCVETNALFPHRLNATLASLGAESRVIHATTDCVFSGRGGHYDETSVHDPVDFYGKSKSLGEVSADRWLNIRCSIIGPELRNRNSLLEWFLGQPPGARVAGYSHHLWNGVTTLQFARLTERLILGLFPSWRSTGKTVHYCPNAAVSKFELLQMFAEAFRPDVDVQSVDAPGPAIDRRLASALVSVPVAPMKDAVDELREYVADMPVPEWVEPDITTAR